MMRSVLGCCVLAIHTVAAVAASPDAGNAPRRGTVDVSGTYTNGNYGFAIGIPAGAHAYMASPPAPNHGVTIVLGDHRTIDVSASFDAALYGSSAALLDALLASSHHDRVERSTILLAGRQALRARTLIGDVDQDIVAQWTDHAPNDAIDVQATLTTTEPADEAIFAATLASFRYTERN